MSFQTVLAPLLNTYYYEFKKKNKISIMQSGLVQGSCAPPPESMIPHPIKMSK